MPNAPKPAKIQPWKAMKTLEENVNPDLTAEPRLFQSAGGDPLNGAAVSKPMNRATANKDLQGQKQDGPTEQAE
ncbi:hypothetical protein SAMD00023353_3701020 [Rosellinia necatrix]|uniref:Uncharacterized protein n=1 Tax=Rosellinia necatrix TaxID=77044 RepID=A0A1W2TM11_ROSNE|nr:hypothetical protein SAMD00023353_3701020 [Rosellinia necatrix]